MLSERTASYLLGPVNRECPRCLSVVPEDAERCGTCGAQLSVRPIPFFPGAASWRAADAPPDIYDVQDGPPRTLESHFDDPALFDDPDMGLPLTRSPEPSLSSAQAPTFDPDPTPEPAPEPAPSPSPVEQISTQPNPTFSLPAQKEPEPSFGESLSAPLLNVRSAGPVPVAEPMPDNDPLFDMKALQQEIQPPPIETSSAQSAVTKHDTTIPNRSFTVAPLWRRGLATAIDALPIAGAGMLCLLAFDKKLEAGGAPLVPQSLHDLANMYWSLGTSTLVISAVILLAVVLYQTFCLGFMHATVGDLLLGLRWVTRDGAPPKPLRAFVRTLLLIPSWLFAGVGVWIFLLTRTRRAFYDIASGCYLVLRD